MRKFPALWLVILLARAISVAALSLACPVPAQPQAGSASAPTKPVEISVTDGPIPIHILVQSPADTVTELQVVCLFQSGPENTLHGSLIEINEKLKGLLDQVRKPALFRGELGETRLITAPAGSLRAKKLLIIGLGDSQTFTPQRMEFVGTVLYQEANRLRVAHPFFAPTIFDGGVTKYSTGQVSEQVVSGFFLAADLERALTPAGAWHGQAIRDLTYLAGPTHASDTKQGIEKAIATDIGR